jgi:LysM repeat protein
MIVGGMRECTPYSSKLLKAKEIGYKKNSKKLIVDKTLPVPKKKPHVKVISVEDMIDRYIKIEPSKRFRGTEDEEYFKTLKRKKKEDEAEEEKPEPPLCECEPIIAVIDQNVTSQEEMEKALLSHGSYTVKPGDTLSKIALMFRLKIGDLMEMNGIKKKDHLKVGQKLHIPYSQKMIDAIASATYKVQEGDTLITIAKKFDLDPKELARYNKIKTSTQIRAGKKLKLPLPYVLAAEKAKKRAKEQAAKEKKKKKTYGSKFIRGFGKHKLRVTATAYSSHGNQTDSTPFLAAWNNRLRPGMKVIAVSRDLLTKYGMKNGTRVKISGLPGIYRVRDKMNKRYRKRIDIYMGTNRRKALRWGRRSVMIYW